MLCCSYYLLCFLFNKVREQEGRTGSAGKQEWGEVAQIVYTHVSKCKNDKIKNFKKKTINFIFIQNISNNLK
jgi:hypothetical protein